MLINDSEFGAPWNDQFYNIEFHFELDQDGIGFVSEKLKTKIVLSGPKDYDKNYILDVAYDQIRSEYDFDYDNIVIDNIN